MNVWEIPLMVLAVLALSIVVAVALLMLRDAWRDAHGKLGR